jgi:hypothetical protein
MKRILLAYIAITLLSLLVVAQAVSIVSANPWAFSKQINPPSGATPPIVTINSPQKNNIYSGAFNITFSVRGIRCSDYFSDIFDVTCTIDNESVTIPDVLPIPQYSTSFVAPTLAAGNHSLTVKATGIAYKPMTVYFTMDSLSQVYFTTSDNCNPSVTSTPTQGESSALDNTANSASPNTSSLLIGIISFAVILVAVSSILLVYYKRHKSKTELVKKL